MWTASLFMHKQCGGRPMPAPAIPKVYAFVA